MTSHELCQRFGISRATFYVWRKRGIVPPPTVGRRGPAVRYGPEHIAAIEAWLALRHHFVSGAAALAYCRDNGITLTDYLRERESSVKLFGIGVA